MNWKDLRERENPFFYCVNAWICPAFLRERVNFPFSPKFVQISPIFDNIPDFFRKFPRFPEKSGLRDFLEKLAWMREFRNSMREFWLGLGVHGKKIVTCVLSYFWFYVKEGQFLSKHTPLHGILLIPCSFTERKTTSNTLDEFQIIYNTFPINLIWDVGVGVFSF